MQTEQLQLNKDKLREAVWFVANYVPVDELGNVKLHKILYFADMLTFVNEGHPLTGVQYLKQKFGPVARHLSATVHDLEKQGRMRVEEVNYYGHFKKNYRALGEEKPGVLSHEERALLIEVADFVRGKSAKEISDISHTDVWAMAELGEVLPYYSALRLWPSEINEDDRDWAVETARKYASEPPTP